MFFILNMHVCMQFRKFDAQRLLAPALRSRLAKCSYFVIISFRALHFDFICFTFTF